MSCQHSSPVQLVEPRPVRPMPIRMTPLIDVVFILLVFFMLTTRLTPVSFLEVSNDTRPTGNSGGTTVPLLTVQADGRAHWQGNSYPAATLPQALQRAGIGEIRLTTLPQTRLEDFTLTLSTLARAGLTAHWVRSAEEDDGP